MKGTGKYLSSLQQPELAGGQTKNQKKEEQATGTTR
jgi:hypothetical protein